MPDQSALDQPESAQSGSKEAFWRLLVCPISKQHLLPASDQQTAELLKRQEVLALKTNEETVLGFLMTQNQTWAYPVIDGVPWLLESSRIKLAEQ